MAGKGAVRAKGGSIEEVLERAEALVAKGDLEEAEALCGELGAECAPAIYALGTLALARRDLDRAVQLLRTATLLDPRVVEFFVALAHATMSLGQPTDCVKSADAALAIDPSLTLAHRLAGEAHLALGNLDHARVHFETVTLRDPEDADAWNGLGLARLRKDEVGPSIPLFRKALDLRPDFAAACVNLAAALENSCRISEGLVVRRRAKTLAPTLPAANSGYLLALNASPDHTSEAIADEHRRWGEELARSSHGRPSPAFANEPNAARRLRVGYVSSDLRLHAVGFFILPALACHDRALFEVHCFAGQANDDASSLQFRKNADHWTLTAGMSDEDLYERIRREGIDILVDLSGYTAGNRLRVFARQAAPVQVTYLGYPNTTGLPTMQYRITDRSADPVGQTEHLYSEELVRPFDSFVCYAPPEGSPEVYDPPVLKRGQITFGSFARGRKISDASIRLWSDVLHSLPESRLVLKPGPVDRRAVLSRFEEHGISSGRVDIVNYSPGVIAHLADYGDIDISLDTFPYHGTTTTCEALWMGVPVVTLAGRDHRSRVGVSLLGSVGLGELIANSETDFVRIAVDLARDVMKLRGIRAAQREKMRQCVLMDGRGFTRALEAAYREMWARWCASRHSGHEARRESALRV